MQQTVAGDNISFNVSRAVSRLKTIFCSFDDSLNPSDAQKVLYLDLLVKKNWNYFYHSWGTVKDMISKKNWNIKFR